MGMTIELAYQTLNLEHGSSEDQVRKQYKKLALKYHPDKNPDNPEASKKFLQISEAYKRITDPKSFEDEDDGEGFNFEEMVGAFFEEFFQGEDGEMYFDEDDSDYYDEGINLENLGINEKDLFNMFSKQAFQYEEDDEDDEDFEGLGGLEEDEMMSLFSSLLGSSIGVEDFLTPGKVKGMPRKMNLKVKAIDEEDEEGWETCSDDE